ncbi:MAG TPA: hypothetical protein VJI98_01690 [Candidatus Nanoarchaeia archaeon]|nr:hypothetical protein [Candidatus Nanoarchaeia archaeon]
MRLYLSRHGETEDNITQIVITGKPLEEIERQPNAALSIFEINKDSALRIILENGVEHLL